jgi:transcriptional regulator with XRE-family HTH domain
MLTVPQIRAARGLLGWTQKELATISGISHAAIAQIERGAGNPRAETLSILKQAFEKYDLEFSDDPGVRQRREPFGVTIWQGREAVLRVWKDIENTFADTKGGEVLLSSLDDALWANLYPKELPVMIRRRQELKITTRSLIKKSDDNVTLPPGHVRVVTRAGFAHAPYYVYADKLVMLKISDPIRVILVQNPTMAGNFRQQFEIDWQEGVVP